MIYVTVGSTHFDELIVVADRLAATTPSVTFVCQIGNGEYEPKACQYFRYSPDHWSCAEKAHLVLTHGGTGSVTRLVRMRKPFVAVANRRLQDDHQVEFLTALSEHSNIVWVDEPDKVEEVIWGPVPVPFATIRSLSADLRDWLEGITC